MAFERNVVVSVDGVNLEALGTIKVANDLVLVNVRNEDIHNQADIKENGITIEVSIEDPVKVEDGNPSRSEHGIENEDVKVSSYIIPVVVLFIANLVFLANRIVRILPDVLCI